MTERTPRKQAPTRTPLPPRRPSATRTDQSVIDRACQRIETAIAINPACVDGFFSRTGCIGAVRGAEDAPAIIALIDADPLSLFDHWYGLAGQWHGVGNGFVAGLLRLPMVDGPDFKTVAGHIRAAWRQTVSHPGRKRKLNLGGDHQFDPKAHNHVFATCDSFEGAIAALERLVQTYDRTRLRTGAVERWWTDDHPAHVFHQRSCAYEHHATGLHHWPDEPFARIDQLPEDPIVWEDCLTGVVEAMPRGLFTCPRVLRHVTRGNEARWRVPETLVYLGQAPWPTPRPWLYGYAWADYTGWTWHGLIQSTCFFDGLTRETFFAFIQNAVFKTDGARLGSECIEMPRGSWREAVQPDRLATVQAAPVHWHARYDELGTGAPESLGPTEAQLATLIRDELSPPPQEFLVDIPYQPLGRMP